MDVKIEPHRAGIPLNGGIHRCRWFQLENDVYIRLTPDEDGTIQSQVFPGLWLAVDAMRSGEMMVVLSVLQAGLNSLAHREFIAI